MAIGLALEVEKSVIPHLYLSLFSYKSHKAFPKALTLQLHNTKYKKFSWENINNFLTYDWWRD